MSRRRKVAPTISPQMGHVYCFVDFVREGRIIACDPSAEIALRHVAAILDDIQQGADPKVALGLGDRRVLRTFRNAYFRDQNLAIAVLQAHGAGTSTVEAAIEQVAAETKLEYQLVRDAYYEHKEHARNRLDLNQRLREVGTIPDPPD